MHQHHRLVWHYLQHRQQCHPKRYGIATIPGRTLNPVDGIEQRGSRTIACILRVNPLNIWIIREEVHKDSLNTFTLVNDSLRADVQTPNGHWINVEFFHETGHDS